MGVPNKQIGWSQEAILLHAVSKQLERLQGIIAASSGGGSSPDLQTILDVGGEAYYEGGLIGAGILAGTPYNRYVDFYVRNEAGTQSSSLGINNTSASIRNEVSGNRGEISISNGILTIIQRIGSRATNLTIGVDPGGDPNYVLPGRASSATFTIATLEDIQALGTLIPTYADNAAAITGGLAVNFIYKTATGEIRVRV